MDAKKDTTNQVVAEFRIVDTQSERYQEIKDHHNCCPLCSTALELKHKTNFVARTVVEEANCSSCQIRTRNETYSLQ